VPPQFCSRSPVSWPPMIFCKNNTNIWLLCVSKFKKIRQIYGFHWSSKNKLQGGFAPWSSDQGLCPWTPLRTLPADPSYRLVLPHSPWGHAPLPRYCGLELPLIRGQKKQSKLYKVKHSIHSMIHHQVNSLLSYQHAISYNKISFWHTNQWQCKVSLTNLSNWWWFSW